MDGTDDDNNINHVPRYSVRSPHRVRGRSDGRPAHAHGHGHGYMDHELSSASPSPSLPLSSPLIPPLVTLGLTQNLRLVEPGVGIWRWGISSATVARYQSCRDSGDSGESGSASAPSFIHDRHRSIINQKTWLFDWVIRGALIWNS